MSKIKLVCYDLHFGTEESYRRLITKIESTADASKEIQKSVWVIVSDIGCKEIRDILGTEIERDGKIFVGLLPPGSAWYNIPGLGDFLETHR